MSMRLSEFDVEQVDSAVAKLRNEFGDRCHGVLIMCLDADGSTVSYSSDVDDGKEDGMAEFIDLIKEDFV